MPNLPEYAEKNREYWSRTSQDWVEPGRRSWADPTIVWGIWSLPESEVQALGDLGRFAGKDVIELGCGTGYVSSWMARLGARPVGIDVTPAQLDSARSFQKEFGIEFPLFEGNAEAVPLPDCSFDFAISEYGASIWCDPYKWIPEAARLLRTGGELMFLRNSTLSMLCTPDMGPAQEKLCRPWRSINRLEWPGEGVEFQLPAGDMVRLLVGAGFRIDNLIELFAPPDAVDTRHEYVKADWAMQWPSEEFWCATKV